MSNQEANCDTHTIKRGSGFNARSKTMTTVESKDSGISDTVPENDREKETFDAYTGEKYWRMRFEQLKIDYDHLQKVNQNLEDKLLTIVEVFDKKKDELIANVEYEKSTLMADVNKLSTKLVDARIKLHDYEEKEILHAAECGSPCHRGLTTQQLNAEMPILTAISGTRQPNNNNNGINKNSPTNEIHKTASATQQQMMDDPNLI